MRENIIAAVIVCTVFFGLTACGERAVEMPKDQTGPEVDVNKETEKYNSDGKLVKEGNAYRWPPVITYIDGDTIEIHTSAGTNVYFCTYYDILQDRFSESYESPLVAEYGKIAYLDWSVTAGEAVLVVEDLFEENGYHEEYYLDIPKVVSAVTDAIFLD